MVYLIGADGLVNQRFAKDLDWFLLIECLWAKCLHGAPVIDPYPYLDNTYKIS